MSELTSKSTSLRDLVLGTIVISQNPVVKSRMIKYLVIPQQVHARHITASPLIFMVGFAPPATDRAYSTHPARANQIVKLQVFRNLGITISFVRYVPKNVPFKV